MFFSANFANQVKGVKFFAILSFLAIGIFVAFRDISVGADTANYYRMYSSLATSRKKESEIEIGYILFVKFLYLLSHDARILFIVQGILVTVSCSYFVIKNTSKIYEAYIAVLAFLAFNLFSFHLSGVRQSIAMSICLFAYEKIKEKKLWRFLIIVAVASLFHTSAIFFFPTYLIANAKDSKARTISIIGTIIGIFFMERIMEIFSLFNDRFSKYGIESTDNGYIFFAIVTVITIFNYVFHTAISKNTNLNAIHSKLNYCSAGMWIMRLFTRVIERISMFYLPSTMVVLAHTYGAMRTNRDKKIYIVLISIILMVLFLYRMKGWNYSFCTF